MTLRCLTACKDHEVDMITIMPLQGIIDMNKNGNLTNFFSYVCNGKKSKELFASTSNRIPISVTCVSSMTVVLNAKFALLLAAHANKKYGGGRRNPTTVPCFPS